MTLLAMEGAHAALGRSPVLHDVSLSVQPGELVALCGPNGAGKSSVLRAAAGLLPLSSGRALLGGGDVRKLSHRVRGERAAYLPQDRTIAWNLPAVEIAALGAPFMSGSEALRRGQIALNEVGVGHLASHGVAEMSGGERARVLLARALAVQAPLLLADEPIAGLDPDAQLLVLERLRVRSDAGGAVLLSLHDLHLAARFADRVIVMDRGRMVADASPLDALSSAILKTVFRVDAVWIDTADGPVLAMHRHIGTT